MLKVTFDFWLKIWLFELLKVSPPLFVIVFGKEIFATMGMVYADIGFALFKTFMCKVEVPALRGGIDVLSGVKLSYSSMVVISSIQKYLGRKICIFSLYHHPNILLFAWS